MKVKILKIISFILISYSFISTYNKVFRIKLDEGDSMKIFYEQKENTVDVLALGSSHVFGSINPAILYRDYGIACYDLCAAGSPTKVSYYYLLEAIKTQKPKVIILGIDDTFLDGVNNVGTEIPYLWTGSMKWSVNKYNLVRDTANDNWLDVFLGYPVNHGRYDGDLAERDFLPYRGDAYHKYYKGNRVFWGEKEEEYDASEFPYTDKVGEFSDDTQKWIDSIVDAAGDISADVLLYAPVSLRSEDVQMTVNAIGEYARQNNIAFVDLNSERELLNMDFDTEMNDKEHVNYLGQEKTSRYVGAYLSANFELPDRRGDRNYESWRLCLEDYQTQYDARMLALHDGKLNEYLELLTDKDYTVFVKIRGEGTAEHIKEEQNGFNKIGVNSDDIKQNCEFIINNGMVCPVELGKIEAFGRHSIVISDDSLQYDMATIGFQNNGLTFIVFDNKQKSIVEYRYYIFDDTEESWVLAREDCGMQFIWNKR